MDVALPSKFVAIHLTLPESLSLAPGSILDNILSKLDISRQKFYPILNKETFVIFTFQDHSSAFIFFFDFKSFTRKYFYFVLVPLDTWFRGAQNSYSKFNLEQKTFQYSMGLKL